MRDDSGIYTCETEGGEDRVQTEITVRAEKTRIIFSPQGRTISEYINFCIVPIFLPSKFGGFTNATQI
jgi:hypothetical protein